MNLKIAVKDLAPCEKLVSVNVAEEAIREEYNNVYREIGKLAKIPGFRPGKAPVDMVARNYKEEAKEEVLKKLISKSLRQALDEKKIEPVVNPEIREIKFEDDKLAYDAFIETRPDIKLGTYQGIKLKKNVAKPEPKEIDQVIDRLREGYAKYTPVESRGLEIGDFMIADLKVIVEGKEIESRQDDWIEFKEKGFVPEFAAAVKGAKPGDEKDIEVNFPKDYPKKEVAGKKGEFKLKLKEIKKRELPEVTPEWVKEVGEYKTVDELREAILRDLEVEKEAQEEHRLQNELLDALLKDSKFDLPKGMVERRLNHLVEDAVRNMVYQGYKQEDAVKEKDDIRKRLQPEAEKQVRLGFIMDEIADKEKIQVTEEELDRKFSEIAARVKQPKEKVMAYYEQEHLIDGLVLQVLNQNVVKFLREKAEII